MQVREAGIKIILLLSTFYLFNINKFLLVGLRHADPSGCSLLTYFLAGERLNLTSEESRFYIRSYCNI